MERNPYWPLNTTIVEENFRVQHKEFGYGTAIIHFSNDEVHVVFDNHTYTQKDDQAKHHRLLLNRLTRVN